MGQINLGKVRGTMIYTGGYVAGSSASGTVFENTGIEKAYEGDLYINTDNSGDYAGCIYECIKPGNALEATWSYKGNIRGPKTATVNSLKSTSTEDALAAYQGNRLFEMMVDAGVFCKNVIVDYDQVAYGLKVRIDNVDSALIIVADGKEYEYTYTASGTAETTKVSIVLGENIGMPQSGGVVSEIRSDNAYIYTYELTGVSAETVYSKNMDLWNSINEALLSHEVTGTVIDGEETLFMGPIHKFVNGIKKAFYPITHAKAVWFDKANKRTVHDEISELNKKLDIKLIKTLSLSDTSRSEISALSGQVIQYGKLVLIDGKFVLDNDLGGTIFLVNNNENIPIANNNYTKQRPFCGLAKETATDNLHYTGFLYIQNHAIIASVHKAGTYYFHMEYVTN